ncbi:MAG: group III truncated hemoglobin [Betaproteobacteria bacterium]|nr:group III truncated hemoglobin [Betaproteobacteria bacterium]
MRTLEPLATQIGRVAVERVVHAFYQKIYRDARIAPFFGQLTDAAAHEAHVADFWWVAMGGRIASRRPFDMMGQHAPLHLTPEVMTVWLALFREALFEELPPELAQPWLQMAAAIGANMRHALRF